MRAARRWWSGARRARWSALAGAILGLLAGCSRGPDFRAELPPPPELSGWPAEFRAMVQTADAAAREQRHAIEAVERLARLYYINGYLEEAWSCLGILVEHEPDNPRWFHFLATILAGYGYLEEAVPLWEHAIRTEPEFVVPYVRLGDALVKLGQPQEAEALLQDALERFPEQPYVLSGLGRIAVEANRWDEARDYLERASRESRFRTGVDLLATVYERLDRADLAADLKRQAGFGQFIDIRDPWVEALLPLCYDADRLANAGGQANFYGNWASGIQTLQRAVQLAPDDALMHYQLGQMALEQNQLTLAQKHLSRTIELDPTVADGWLRLVELHRRLGRPQEAESYLAQGLQHCPNSPSLRIENGDRLERAGRIEAAIAEFRRAGEIRPNEARSFIRRASAYFSIDQVAEGLESLEAALNAEPGNPVALSSIAFYHIQTGDREEAAEFLTRVRNHPRIERDTRLRLEAAFAQRFP